MSARVYRVACAVDVYGRRHFLDADGYSNRDRVMILLLNRDGSLKKERRGFEWWPTVIHRDNLTTFQPKDVLDALRMEAVRRVCAEGRTP